MEASTSTYIFSWDAHVFKTSVSVNLTTKLLMRKSSKDLSDSRRRIVLDGITDVMRMLTVKRT